MKTIHNDVLDVAKATAAKAVSRVLGRHKPKSMLLMVIRMARHFTEEEVRAFSVIEKYVGEDEANKWLAHTMSETGLYIWNRETNEVAFKD